MVGSSSYVVMDTDYDNHAMVCTCQDMDLFFTFAHRRSALDIYNIYISTYLHIYRSCSILQRSPTEDEEITQRMSALLDGQIDEASHDFDRIKQEVSTRTAPMITKYFYAPSKYFMNK